MPENSSRSTKRVFLEMAIDGENVGKIIIELFDKLAPKTCENFRVLCTGECEKIDNVKMTYKGSTFHRVIKGFMIQGGDITEGDGTGGMSIYGRTFDDEDFIESHSEPYVLSMANKGPNTNSSQFFITTAIAPHCNQKHVVFGRVVKGHSVVDKIERLRVNSNSKPLADVTIINCGELFRKKKTSENEEEQPKEVAEKHVVEEKEEESVSTIKASDLPEEPRNNSFLMRRSKSRSKERKQDDSKKRRRSRSDERRRRRSRSADRNRRHRNSRSRSRSPNRRRDSRGVRDRLSRRSGRSRSPRRNRRSSPVNYVERRNERIKKETGVKVVKGRGAMRFMPDRRSVTPPHWRKEQERVTTLKDLHKKRIELGGEDVVVKKQKRRDDDDEETKEEDDVIKQEIEEKESDSEASSAGEESENEENVDVSIAA